VETPFGLAKSFGKLISHEKLIELDVGVLLGAACLAHHGQDVCENVLGAAASLLGRYLLPSFDSGKNYHSMIITQLGLFKQNKVNIA